MASKSYIVLRDDSPVAYVPAITCPSLSEDRMSDAVKGNLFLIRRTHGIKLTYTKSVCGDDKRLPCLADYVADL